ncbi:MAG: hypothetical protein HWE34_09115 [Methylocystaceae bacterium]|nr:hypothetical protein [Methylocystaceae bacterium]
MMQKSNEELVIEAKDKADMLKKEWMNFLKPISLKVQNGTGSFTSEEYLEYLEKAHSYFNFLEEFVGRTSLLRAHENGVWLHGFADTCYENLRSYLLHIQIRNQYAVALEQTIPTPGKYSYANLQGVVKEYCDDEIIQELESDFKELNLPITGFQRKRLTDTNKFTTIMSFVERVFLGKWYVRVPKWMIWLGVGLLAPDIWFYIADFVASMTQATYEKSQTIDRPFDPSPWILIGIGVFALVIVYYVEELPKHKKKTAP